MQRLGFRSDAKRDSLGEAIMVYFNSDHLVVHMSDDLLFRTQNSGRKNETIFWRETWREFKMAEMRQKRILRESKKDLALFKKIIASAQNGSTQEKHTWDDL